jgi:hypothetical protein
MDGATLLDRLRADYESELSRLASSKALYALTGGEMDAASVRAAVAADAAAAAGTFEGWTADAADDGPVADLFARAAAAAAAHRETVAAAADAADAADADRDVEPYPIYDDLATATDAPARLGGLLARSLLAGETVAQAVGFFVGDANPTAADEFRGVRREVESLRDDAVATLDDVCADADDWSAAEAAGREAVETAYGAYVDRLESMGIKPKNVC